MNDTAETLRRAEYEDLGTQASVLADEITGLQDRIDELREQRKKLMDRRNEIVAELTRDQAAT